LQIDCKKSILKTILRWLYACFDTSQAFGTKKMPRAKDGTRQGGIAYKKSRVSGSGSGGVFFEVGEECFSAAKREHRPEYFPKKSASFGLICLL
jgi:hypothetical protein